MALIERLTDQAGTDAPLALVFPGVGYTVQAPLLYWPILALTQAGWQVWSVNWHADIDEVVRADPASFVRTTLAEVEAALPKSPEVVIGKSFGTYALPSYVDQNVRAVWLTPLLTVSAIAESARAASDTHLLVGGTDDPSWETGAIRGTAAKVVELRSADHSLETNGVGWRKSATNQIEAIQAVVSHILPGR